MEDKVKKIMADVFGMTVAAIGPDASPETISKWDSLGHMNLCLALENEFDVEFNDRQVVEMKSVDAIVKTLSGIGVS